MKRVLQHTLQIVITVLVALPDTSNVTLIIIKAGVLVIVILQVSNFHVSS